MTIIKSGHELLQACHELKAKIALVPTMGALREGVHLHCRDEQRGIAPRDDTTSDDTQGNDFDSILLWLFFYVVDLFMLGVARFWVTAIENLS